MGKCKSCGNTGMVPDIIEGEDVGDLPCPDCNILEFRVENKILRKKNQRLREALQRLLKEVKYNIPLRSPEMGESDIEFAENLLIEGEVEELLQDLEKAIDQANEESGRYNAT